MSLSTLSIRSSGGLSRVLAQYPEPSLRMGDESGGRIRCWISKGTGCASQVSGNTGGAKRPEPAFTSVLGALS